VNAFSSGSCPKAGFGICDVESTDSAYQQSLFPYFYVGI
jgi:hypothetical protein